MYNNVKSDCKYEQDSSNSETLDDFETMIQHNAQARKRDKKSKYCSFEQYKTEINEYIERRAKELGIQD